MVEYISQIQIAGYEHYVGNMLVVDVGDVDGNRRNNLNTINPVTISVTGFIVGEELGI